MIAKIPLEVLNSPHAIPYQGSKRKMVKDILSYVNFQIDTFYEPFAGSAAVTVAASTNELAKKYVINDKLEPLAKLWNAIVNNPEKLTNDYEVIWNSQMSEPDSFYLKIRNEFNIDKSDVKLLYLVARCVKNAVRFNSNGEFNQSADKRRFGVNPSKLRKNVFEISSLLKGKVEIYSKDFTEILVDANPNDCVYLDPPYQGTSTSRDQRYAYILDFDNLVNELNRMNQKSIPFLLSFDGSLGGKSYGKELPDSLNLRRIEINAGRSSQATLLGREDVTIESLYISPSFIEKNFSGYKKRKILNRQYSFIAE